MVVGGVYRIGKAITFTWRNYWLLYISSCKQDNGIWLHIYWIVEPLSAQLLTISLKSFLFLIMKRGVKAETETLMSNKTWCLRDYNLSPTVWNFGRLKICCSFHHKNLRLLKFFQLNQPSWTFKFLQILPHEFLLIDQVSKSILRFFPEVLK